jgi:cell division septum initiation protein DivIVA
MDRSDPNWWKIQPDDEMIENSFGSLVAKRLVAPAQLFEDQTVQKLADEAAALSQVILDFRTKMFEEVDAFLDLVAERYGARRRSRGNVILTSYDGKTRIEVSTANFITLGPELQAAKSLIDECLTRWSEGANDNLRTIVQDAFEVGEEGRLRVDRVLALRRVHIDDPQWRTAMQAISDAVRVTHSKRYVRFHRRENQDAPWKQIVLDVARVS